jgi:hypothetical protein
MYALLFVLIVLLFLLLKTREHFGAYVAGPSWFSTSDDGGTEIFSIYPNTCAANKELSGLLCYDKCRPGFHGVLSTCWADTQNVGIGTPVGLEPCQDGWVNDGLTCRKPIGCDGSLKGLFGECWGYLNGGQVVGRLNNGGVCPGPGGGSDHTDKVDGLCYKKCPKELPSHVAGMPYLCSKGEGLSYPRDAGSIPPLVRFLRR